MKIRSLTVMLLAFALFSSSAQANLIGFLRGVKQEQEEKEEAKKPKDLFKAFLQENGKKPKLKKLWERICGSEEIEWNVRGGDPKPNLGRLLKRLKNLCKAPPYQENAPRLAIQFVQFDPQSPGDNRTLPGTAVPEPSTYGMIGAGALLGLVILRRFKQKKAK